MKTRTPRGFSSLLLLIVIVAVVAAGIYANKNNPVISSLVHGATQSAAALVPTTWDADGPTSPALTIKKGASTAPAETTAPPATKTFQTTLVSSSASPLSYEAQWSSSNPNYYINTTGGYIVLKSIDFHIDSARYRVGKAALDACLIMTKVGDALSNGHQTLTGVENLCVNERKGETSSLWPKSDWHIVLPGQGLLVPPGYLIGCNTHGDTAGSSVHPTTLANFSCTLTFAKAVASPTNPPVQTLRAPYMDQEFSAEVSWFSPHINLTALSSHVRGVWVDISSDLLSRSFCLFHHSDTDTNGNNWDKTCTASNVSGDNYASQTAIQPYDVSFSKGDRITGTCNISNASKKGGNYCGFYMFVDVPISNGTFAPFGQNSTIENADADHFCNGPYRDYYHISDGAFEADRSACLSALKPTS